MPCCQAGIPPIARGGQVTDGATGSLLQALLQSSHMYAEAKHAFQKHGVLVEGVAVDVAAMQGQKASAVDGLTKGIEGLFKKNKARKRRVVRCLVSAAVSSSASIPVGQAARPTRHTPWSCTALQVQYVQGWGKLRSATEVEVSAADGTTTTLAAKNIVIATGSEVTPLPGVPVDEHR